MALWPAFEAAGIRIVGCRHEQGCAYAADGYARSTGKLGVALVTTGPGAANTLGAVGEAWASKSPVLVIATDIPSNLRRDGVYTGVLHECQDQAGLFKPVTKTTTRDIHEAIDTALSAPQGPTYYEIPTDKLRQHEQPLPKPKPQLLPLPLDANIFPTDIGERPLIWVGGGAKHAHEQIDAFARRVGAPVIATYSARGVLPAGHSHLVPVPPHEPAVASFIAQSDCIIVIGSDLDAMNTMAFKLPLPARRIAINVDAADAAKNYQFDSVIEVDASNIDAWTGSLTQRDPWFGDLAVLEKTVRAELRDDAATAESVCFVEDTERALRNNANPVVFADMCVAGYWAASYIQVSRPRGLHYPMGWGTLGWAFPASIGPASADIPSVAFVGDGGMLFALGELATVAQEQLPLTVVVVDDGGYGMLRYPASDALGCELAPVDFVAVAKGFGITACCVGGVGDEYSKALAESLSSRAPRLVHVKARLFPPRTTSPRWPIK